VGKVLLWGGISAAAWNATLLLVGALVVKNLDEFMGLLERYTALAWSVMGVLVAALVVRFVVARIRRRRRG